MGKSASARLRPVGNDGRQAMLSVMNAMTWRIAALAVSALLGTACEREPRSVVPPSDRALTQRFFGLNGVIQGDSAAKVRRLLGPAPEARIAFEKQVQDTVTTWVYPELSIGFIRGVVHDIECNRAPCATPAGIALGDSVRRVVDIYGPADPLPSENLYTLLYANGRSGCGVTFVFDREVVIRIRVWCDRS